MSRVRTAFSTSRRYSLPLLVTLAAICLLSASNSLQAGNPTVAPMIRLIESGRLPEERIPTVVELICKRGDAEDLQYLFQKAASEDTVSSENRSAMLTGLANTMRDRKLKPSGDLTQLRGLLKRATADKNLALQKQVIELVGLWKVQGMAGELADTLKQGAAEELTGAMIGTLAELKGEDSVRLITDLTKPDQPKRLRRQAIVALAGIDLSAAAEAAGQYIADADTKDNFDSLLKPFLARQQGPDLLGKAIAARELNPDVAKLVLRSMLTSGKNEAALADPLSEAAGLGKAMEPMTKEQLQQLAQEVAAHGDAARGEQVFRREELNCYKCHAIGKAGANIGPDLSAVGGSSPIDYLVNSLLLPSQAIKEAYKTALILDIDGLSHTGIVVDRDDERVVLRDAQGKEVTIAEDDIEFEKEGDSLMPSGLTKFLTHQEFVDLVRYLSALGKDDGYTMTAEPTVYRWRVYRSPAGKTTVPNADDDSIRNMLFEYAPEKWTPFYSLASGELPLGEARGVARNPMVFAYAEIVVNVAGNIQLQLNNENGVLAWLDNRRVAPSEWQSLHVDEGEHRLMFRIDTREFPAEGFTAKVLKGSEPAAEYTIVVGE
ncbi:c-type cytochrome [bacterium]|nr:c-type cytochrome [bacterium]